jgi:cyclopropane fatty-acyl-phospholipid synthase-like methyltransferase
MIKYTLAALTLKLFSLNGITKKKNINIDPYLRSGKLLRNLCEKYSAVKEGDELLEIGTGWLHWYSIYLRLFFKVRITMLDIWDNRQLTALKTAFRKLNEISDKNKIEYDRFIEDVDTIGDVKNFGELYSRYDLSYTLEEKGSLDKFPDSSFDFIFSFHVLEHVPKENTKDLVKNLYRTLKPGAYSVHQIGIDDHLSHLDKRESLKNYLRYSDSTWKRYFENEVQYFNRLQMSDWLDLFRQAGFVLKEKIIESKKIDSLKIAPKYQHYSKEDLECIILTIVQKKII